MAKWSLEVTGMTELFRALEKAGDKAEKIAAESLYEGAGVVADAISNEIDNIKTAPFEYASNGKKRKPSPEEKAIIQNAKHGVAKFIKIPGMEIKTSVGYQDAGYAYLKGKMVPVAKIANSINSGTSFMTKQAFIRKAQKQNEAKAEQTIVNGIIKRLDELGIE